MSAESTNHFYYSGTGEDLQAFIASLPPYAALHLPKGTYKAKLVIRTRGLSIIGDGADQTVITYDDYAKKLDDSGLELNTFRSYTVAVCADDVTMTGLTIENSSLQPEIKGQEVALTVYGDNFLMQDCALLSTQDTLFAGPLPADLVERYQGFLPDELRQGRPLSQRFCNCLIAGTVDFIFGCGDARFEHCEIRSLYDARNIGYAAAPAHSPDQTVGFVFYHCSFTCEQGVADGSIYLARPWRDYGLSVFDHCQYGSHIAPCGFNKWEGTERDRTARFIETPAVDGRADWVNRDR